MFLNEFIDYLKIEKRYSPHTVVSYENDLNQFIAFLSKENNIASSELDVKAINHFAIREWIVVLVEEKLQATSINRKLSTLKSYFKFLKRRAYIEHNPMLKVVAPKKAKKLPVFIDEGLMDKLLSEQNFTGKEAILEQLIMELLYGTGIRLSELITIKQKDIDLYNLQITVLGKRNKQRIIPISNHLKNLINQYNRWITSITKTNAELFLADVNGAILKASKVQKIVKKYLSLFTTLSKKSPHVLRHTFATHLLNQGADITAIKELLGHANLAATQIYTHNSIDKLKKSYNLAHPKA